MGLFLRVRLRKNRGGRSSNGNPPFPRSISSLTPKLARKLEDILKDLISLEQRGKVTQFLNGTQDADKLSGLVQDIRDVLMEYQVRNRNKPASLNPDIYFRPRYNKTSTIRAVNSS